MVDPSTPSQSIEERKDLGTDDAAIWAYWTGQEAIAEKEERKWIKRSREIVKRYRDERPESENSSHKFNILWANVQTLKPTLYGRTPKPDVERRFKDNATPCARYAATLMQECLSFSVGAFSFDAIMKAVVEDRLLPGRGVARVLYVPHFGEPDAEQADEGQDESAPDKAQTNPDGNDPGAAPEIIDGDGDEGEGEESDDGEQVREAVRPVIYEEVIAKYVFWEDYREGPARQWDEVPWTRYRSYMTRSELGERFGKKKAKLVELDYTPKSAGSAAKEDPPPDLYKKAIVHEYWDKSKKEVVWLAPGTPDLILDSKDDPLELTDFFPSPDPLLATTTNDKRIPVPDYAEYQDQARELDKLTGRIDVLTKALKMAGVYAGENKQVLQQLFDEGTENKLIPVGDLTRWAEGGGLKGFIEWLPIDQIAATLIQLYNARDRVKAVLYELTGIGDILRGMTEPDETLGAQELKAVFATRRITPQQKDVARFARDLIRLMGGIVAAHFSEKTISMITGYPQLAPVPPLPPRPTPPPMPTPMPGLPAPMLGGGVPPQMPGAPPRPPMNMPPPQSTGAAMPAPGGVPPGPSGNGAMPPGMPPHPPLPMGGPPQAPGPMAGAPPSMPGQPTASPPPPPPDPQQVAYQQAEAQWQAMAKQVQAITQANQKKQQEFSQACALIKADGVHGFKIDIETDSTIAPDEQAEKKARTEFIGAFVPLMEQLIPVAQGNPAIADLAKEIALFGVRGFPVARSLEESIGKAFDAIAKMPPPQPKGPQAKAGDSPQALAVKQQDIQSKERIADQKAQTERESTAVEARGDELELQAKREDDQGKLALSVMDTSHRNAISGARLTHVEGRPEPGPVQ